jgi:hypothetical protein
LSSSRSISNSPNVRVSGVPPEGADRVGSVEVRQHEDVEQLGAGSGTEGVEACPESAFKLVGSHGSRLR